MAQTGGRCRPVRPCRRTRSVGSHGRGGGHQQRGARLQAAAAEAGEIAADATAGLHHAEAEQQPARQRAGPQPALLAGRCCRPRSTRPGRVQRLAADQRHRERQRPHPQPAQAAEQDRVADAAHGAEMAALEHDADGNAEQQEPPIGRSGGPLASPSLTPTTRPQRLEVAPIWRLARRPSTRTSAVRLSRRRVAAACRRLRGTACGLRARPSTRIS